MERKKNHQAFMDQVFTESHIGLLRRPLGGAAGNSETFSSFKASDDGRKVSPFKKSAPPPPPEQKKKPWKTLEDPVESSCGGGVGEEYHTDEELDNWYADDEVQQEVEIGDFKFNPAIPFPSIVLFGKRFSGKSVTAGSIASKFPHIHRWAAWCGSKGAEKHWSNMFESPATVHGTTKKDLELLEQTVVEQNERLERYELQEKTPKVEDNLGIILDDVTSVPMFTKSDVYTWLACNARQANILLMTCCQYPKQLGPAIRTNTDYVFIMFNPKKALKIIYEEFIQDLSLKAFTTLVKQVTAQKTDTGEVGYNSLVYDQAKRNINISDVFFVYRDTWNFDHTAVKLGSEAWRKWNQKNYKNTKRLRLLKIIADRQRKKRMAAHPQTTAAAAATHFEKFTVVNRGKDEITFKIRKFGKPEFQTAPARGTGPSDRSDQRESSFVGIPR